MKPPKDDKSSALMNILFFTIIIIVAAALIYIDINSKYIDRESNDIDMIVGFHIKGEVKNPGYYELKYGCRVKDAIKEAGGELENADIDAVNLAELLRDGQELIIPSISGDSAIAGNDNKNSNYSQEKININSATKSQLVKIKGIGESIASDIVEYRNKNGRFDKIEDLKKVNGIGNNKYNEIKDYICVK